MTPEIVDVIRLDRGVGEFRSHDGSYVHEARTSCGHNLVYWRKLGCVGIEYYGVTLHCATCGEIQSLGPAARSSRSDP